MDYVSTGSTSQGGYSARLGAILVVPSPSQHDDMVHRPLAALANGGDDHVSPLSGHPNLDAKAGDAPLKFRSLDSVLRQAPLVGSADGHLTEVLLALIDVEPSSVEEAVRDQHWKAAMLEELESSRENKTWSMVELRRGHRPSGLKWVFKLKHDDHGEVIKHNAQLVPKWFVQR
jgi:hypothetical protein